MATWNNLDTLASYKKLAGLKNHVDIKEAMSGENGAIPHLWQRDLALTMLQSR